MTFDLGAERQQRVATNRQPSDRDDEQPVTPPMDDARRAALLRMPGVIVHRRDPNWTHWTFEPSIRVRKGFDVSAAIDREQDDEDQELMDLLFSDR